ncbi:hypothetical protein [Streptomyces sp. NPDC056061]|uniref:hypothetical protein n=1 Tax=Streptomyces sp. NPDC056061 TaxID=3345700 RepID=UPI0035E2E594
MSELGIALIAAGAAIVGSIATGWYTRSAGLRQAEAARRAGERQADALLETVRMTLREQAAVRVLDLRRQTYVRFLEAAETRILAERSGAGGGGDEGLLERALGTVLLEGPAEVASAAQVLADRLRRHEAPDDVVEAKLAFVSAARQAVNESLPAR